MANTLSSPSSLFSKSKVVSHNVGGRTRLGCRGGGGSDEESTLDDEDNDEEGGSRACTAEILHSESASTRAAAWTFIVQRGSVVTGEGQTLAIAPNTKKRHASQSVSLSQTHPQLTFRFRALEIATREK